MEKKKLAIKVTESQARSIESSRMLMEYNYNTMADEAGSRGEEEVLKSLRETGFCPQRKTISDLTEMALYLSINDDFIGNLAAASSTPALYENMVPGEGDTLKTEEDATTTFLVEIDKDIAEVITDKAKTYSWPAYPESGPDIEFLAAIILVERHNDAHNAVLEHKEDTLKKLRANNSRP